MSVDPFLQATLSAYLDADATGQSGSVVGVHSQYDLDLHLLNQMGPSSTGGAQHKTGLKVEGSPIRLQEPLSPPDSSLSWSCGSAPSSDSEMDGRSSVHGSINGDGTSFPVVDPPDLLHQQDVAAQHHQHHQDMVHLAGDNALHDGLSHLNPSGADLFAQLHPQEFHHDVVPQQPHEMYGFGTWTDDASVHTHISGLDIPASHQRSHQQQQYQPSQPQPETLEESCTTQNTTQTAGRSRRKVDPAEKQRRKSMHNAIERRYRNSINDQITNLRQQLPDFIISKSESSKGTGAKTALNKSKIIEKGIEYIHHLESTNKFLYEENCRLQALVKGTERGTASMTNNVDGSGVAAAVVPSTVPKDISPSLHSKTVGVAGDKHGACDDQSQERNAKRFRVDPGIENGGRVLLSVMAMGLFVVNVSLTPPEAAGSSTTHGTAGTARVLASMGDGTDNASSPGPFAELLSVFLSYWLWRLAMVVVFVVLLLKQDTVTDPTEARDNESKCLAAVKEGNLLKAEHHAAVALALTSSSIPVSKIGLVLGLAKQVVRQFLHRVYIGVWVDRLLASTSRTASSVVHVDATMHHALLHVGICRRNGVASKKLLAPGGDLSRMYTALRALNAAESVKKDLDPLSMIKMYVSVAIQVQLCLQKDMASILLDYYLRHARRIYAQQPACAPTFAWLFKPDGDSFFRRTDWCDKVSMDSSRKLLNPGSFEQLQSAYHLNLLEEGLVEIIAGVNTDRAQDLFEDLRDSAARCGDPQKEWWGTMGLVQVAWRRGQKHTARKHLCSLVAMEWPHASKVEHLVYAATRARQALLDGNQKLCWQALEVASKACEQWDVVPAADGDVHAAPYSHLWNLARLVGHQLLLETRVALVRLRTYLREDPLALGGTKGLSSPGGVRKRSVGGGSMTPPLVAEDDMSQSRLQNDIVSLRRFSQVFPLAQSHVYKYQAIHRSLAGGRVALTEHIFHKSLKSARQMGLPYAEASTLLHTAVHLHNSMTAQSLRQTLSRAVSIFERLQAVEELGTSRKLLQLVV
eukprot:m.581695 g.581695  ORF g.581695 m.581695 type:complete len:1031 (+) comp22329_c0_seq1:241-3333(+)